MDRLLEAAAVDCEDCGKPTQRLEVSWKPVEFAQGGLFGWAVAEAALVCDDGHRSVLELFET